MSADSLVRDSGVFYSIERQCDFLVDRAKRLPDYVFKRRFKSYSKFEFAYVSRLEFTDLLTNLAVNYRDSVVNYINIEPDPASYFKKLHGFYGAASFLVSDIGTDYLETMTRGGRADSFLYRGGDIGAFWGTSLDWIIYFDRVSWEIAILATSLSFDAAGIGIRSFSNEEIYQYSRSLYANDTLKADQFSRQIIENYS